MKLALEIDREASVLILVEALKEQLSSEGIEHGQDLRLYEVRINFNFNPGAPDGFIFDVKRFCRKFFKLLKINKMHKIHKEFHPKSLNLTKAICYIFTRDVQMDDRFWLLK